MERRRSAPRLAGLLACAVAPAMLLAGCTGSSSGGSTDATGSGTGGSASPTLAPERFGTLPAPCSTVTKATVTAVVPKAKNADGTAAESSDISVRAGCSWTGNGSDGYQYRWLSVTLQRFTTAAVTGVGDQASSVSGKATVSDVTSQNDTVVARTGNIVLIVEYNGAGLEGKKDPTATTVNSDAQRAAKDVVAALAAASPSPSGTSSSATPSGTGSLNG